MEAEDIRAVYRSIRPPKERRLEEIELAVAEVQGGIWASWFR